MCAHHGTQATAWPCVCLSGTHPIRSTERHCPTLGKRLWITLNHSNSLICRLMLKLVRCQHKPQKIKLLCARRAEKSSFFKERKCLDCRDEMCSRLGPPLRTETAARGAVYLCWWQQHRVTAPDRLPPPPCPWLEVSGTGCAKHQHLTKISPLLSVFSAMRANCPLFSGEKSRKNWRKKL